MIHLGCSNRVQKPHHLTCMTTKFLVGQMWIRIECISQFPEIEDVVRLSLFLPRAVTSLCWQRAKPVIVNENNCTTEMALLGSALEDLILMPDPLPAVISSSLATSMTTSGSRTTVRSGEGGGNENRPIFDWKSSSLPKQEDASFAQLSSTPISSRSDDASSITPPEAWGGERLSDRLSHLRQSGNMPSRFAISTSGPLAPGTMLSGLQDNFPATQSISSLTSSSLSLANLHIKENSNEETSLGSSEHVPSSSTSLSIEQKAHGAGDGTSLCWPPKLRKTGAETREELLNSLLSRSDTSSATAASAFQAMNGEVKQSQKSTLLELQEVPSHQLFQRHKKKLFLPFKNPFMRI
ncbi:hypothetical protein HAX54_002870 [Datura stramonium]|uniref:Uncharacterized protein n=1 Tax=Datura stramonium TaxID=4076 RepID=A0ABS8T5T8_DATST|nr:hypothetical protein [Datura stramonium]